MHHPGHRRPADIDFPHAGQVFLVERTTIRTVYRRDKNSKEVKETKVRHLVALLGIISLTADQASSEHLATSVRSHWMIASIITGWNVTCREDSARARSGTAPRAMASIQYQAISLARTAAWNTRFMP